jgi:hypothetical protein
MDGLFDIKVLPDVDYFFLLMFHFATYFTKDIHLLLCWMRNMKIDEAKLIIAQRISNAINERYEIPILETVLSHELGTEVYKSAIDLLQGEGSIEEEVDRSSKELDKHYWVLTEFGKKEYILK